MSHLGLKHLTCPSELVRQAFQAYSFEHRITEDQELFILRLHSSSQEDPCVYTVPATQQSDGRLTVEWDKATFTPPLDLNDPRYSEVDQQLLLVYQRLI
ncbi:hypothetical protein [Paenibacillus pini]|uniref:hypothetical protein n=1 Tax=Paenibacillus pini TaxID=669461 RepID=UPI00056AAF3F|nr:hypothetical protein [Paenibacillus pini]